MLACQPGKLLVERERGGGARGIVRVADPEERELVPALEGVEVGKPPRFLRQRHGHDAPVREERPAFVNRVRRLGNRDEVLLGERDLREREDRLLRAEGGEELAVLDLDLVAALDPGPDRRPQLGQPGGARIRRAFADRTRERLANEGRRDLAWIADAEVDQLAPAAPLVESSEGVLLELRENR